MRTIARTIRTTAAVTVERARALSRPRITAARPIIAARASRGVAARAGDDPSFTEIDAGALRELLETADDEDTFFVDVRERDEWDAARLPRFELKPLSAAGEWLETLPRDKTLVVLCKAGVRSAKACEALAVCGYTKLVNCGGGIMAYIDAYGLPE